MTVAVMAVCGALLIAGLSAGWMWSSRPFCAPPDETAPSAGEVARRLVWYAALALGAGVLAGVTVIGAGGRLAMRLLAVTASDDAQGRITEADEVVGEITVDGTIGFVLFNGIVGGVLAAALYLLVRRLLPSGRLAGLSFGLGLLVVLGTTIDPLRDDNPDFDIVGPGWLSVVVFAALALAFGLALTGITARLSAWLPLPSTERRTLVRYIGPAVVALVAYPLTIVLAVVGAVVVAATRWRGLLAAVRSPGAVLVGRVVAVGVVLVALPQALSSIADIAGR